MRELRLGRLAGLEVSALPSAIIGSLVLWVLLSSLGLIWLRLPPGPAIAGGLIALVLHWLGEIVHQLGHAWAARRAGYPMIGIRMWGVLSSSVYPANESVLSGRIHIQRALGGPALSLLIGLLLSLLAAALYPMGGLPRYLSLFAALDNVFVFGLGALLPLGFNDGSTLLCWWGKP